MEIKHVDRCVLNELRKNARIRITKIAKKIKIPLSTVFDRVKILEREIIQKNVTLLNFMLLGFHIRAHIAIGVDRKERIILKKYILASKNVNNLYKINNGYDLLVECIFVDVTDYEDFLSELKEAFTIKKLETHLLVKDIVREQFFTKETVLGAH